MTTLFTDWKSDYVGEFPAGLAEVLLAAARSLTSPHSAILVMQLGGAMGRVEEGESAVSHRNARYIVNFSASWEHTPDEAHVAWARQAFSAMAPFSLGGGYVNFLTADELAASDVRVRAAYGPAKYARLAAVKARWDPTNLFRHNQNIRPGVPSEMREGRVGTVDAQESRASHLWTTRALQAGFRPSDDQRGDQLR